MGACLSSRPDDYTSASRHPKPSANVVSADSVLRQYSLPATIADVLRSQSLSSESFFICNSDRLYFGDFIPPLHPSDELQQTQIYFVLPVAKLQYRLTAADMASLAVIASVALDQINASNRRRRRRTRISPVLAADNRGDVEDPQSNQTVSQRGPILTSGRQDCENYGEKYAGNSSSAGLGVSRSGSVRKFTRYSSRRAKLAIGSFRKKLNTIYECY